MASSSFFWSAQGVAEVVVGGGRIRTNGHGRGVEPNRPFVVLLLVQCKAQVEIEPEISRVDVLGVPQKPEGGVRVLHSLEGAGQTDERRRVLRPNVDRVGQPAQFVLRLRDRLPPGGPQPVPQRLRIDAARDGHQPLPAGGILF